MAVLLVVRLGQVRFVHHHLSSSKKLIHVSSSAWDLISQNNCGCVCCCRNPLCILTVLFAPLLLILPPTLVLQCSSAAQCNTLCERLRSTDQLCVGDRIYCHQHEATRVTEKHRWRWSVFCHSGRWHNNEPPHWKHQLIIVLTAALVSRCL